MEDPPQSEIVVKPRLSYALFTVSEVTRRFGLTTKGPENLFEPVSPQEPSAFLRQTLVEGMELVTASPTEKARSETLITPILQEARRSVGKTVTLFSGLTFEVSPSEGLTGVCDYLIALGTDPLQIETPVLAVVEAKKEDIRGGIGQCLAEMVAAQRYNQQNKQSNMVREVYGAVSTGEIWRFLKLEQTAYSLDSETYSLGNLPKLLGVLQSILQQTERETDGIL